MLEPVYPILFCVGGKAQEERSIQIVIGFIYVGIVMMKYIVLDSPNACVGPDEVHGVTHVLIYRLVFGIRTVDRIVHYAHTDPCHSKSAGNIKRKEGNWGSNYPGNDNYKRNAEQ